MQITTSNKTTNFSDSLWPPFPISALDIIREARFEKVDGNNGVRKFRVPQQNFSANSYYELIPKSQLKGEPSLLGQMSLLEMSQFEEKPLTTVYRCTTVASERIVQIMTKCALRVTDPKEQVGIGMN